MSQPLQVIVSGDGWVLDRYGKILADGFGGVVRTEPEEMPSDGITYLMNYAQVRKLTSLNVLGKRYGKVVSMVTHVDYGPLLELLNCALMRSDALVHMSEATLDEFKKATWGMRESYSSVIELPVLDCYRESRPRVGIAACRNMGNETRKGWDLVDRLRAEHQEWEIDATYGVEDGSDMVDWYRSIDVYLCASRLEGGPMGVAEAAAMGVPIVAPRGVGWCDQYAQETFVPGDYDDMERAVERACGRLHQALETPSVDGYIAQHRALFSSLAKRRK